MNAWLLCATASLLGLVPCGVACVRGQIFERLVALQLAQTVAILVLVALAIGFGRSFYIDMALTLAVLSLGSGLVFARFLERWL